MTMLVTIFAGVLIFTALVLLLVVVLLGVGHWLLPKGSVELDINHGDRVLKTPPGRSLLDTLATQRIFLPSACGGSGTCAMCKCQVLAGGGKLLPTESGQLTRAERNAGQRLACQLKVKENLKLRIPNEILKIRKYACTVRSNRHVATFIKELVLELPDDVTLDFRAGGYIQIDVPPYPDLPFRSFRVPEPYRADWDRFELWSLIARNDAPCFRAYSLANHPQENDIIMLNIRIATPPPGSNAPPGICSSHLFQLQPGDSVVISGPYGEFFAQESAREMCFIGGGAGMAPLRSHILDQLLRIETHRQITFWYGGRSRRELFYLDEFRALEKRFPNFTMHIALSDPRPEDGWNGPTGFIHQIVFEHYLDPHPDPTEIEYYLCGPPMMIDCVKRMLHELGVEPEMIRADDFGI